jgi:hypothetical protein
MDSGPKRVKATAELYELLRQWEAGRNVPSDVADVHRLVRSAVVDEMVWLIRYADPYLQVGGAGV